MDTEYKGYRISYNETTEEFVVRLKGGDFSDSSLGEIRAYIDRFERKSFERFDAIINNSGYGYERVAFNDCVVTSIDFKHNDAWVMLKGEDGGRRRKEVASHLILSTEANRVIIASLEQLSEDRKKLQELAIELGDELEKYPYKDLEP